MEPIHIHFEPFTPPEKDAYVSKTTKRAKILMLHGHGQSGRFFYYKTTRLIQMLHLMMVERHLREYGDGMEFLYPNGALHASDDPDADVWTWGLGDFQRKPINGIDKSIKKIADILETQGPFVGIIGFSTGAAVAAIVASLLERQQPNIFPMPMAHPPIRFVICFSGFRLGHPNYAPLYSPSIQTPVLHFIADLDTMIPKELTEELARRCSNGHLQYFEGTHYVPPRPAEMASACKFILQCLGGIDPGSPVYTTLQRRCPGIIHSCFNDGPSSL